MANTANSFAALLGAGGEAAINAGGKKKKKNKSKKPSPDDAGAKAVEVEERPASAPVASKKNAKPSSQHQPSKRAQGSAPSVSAEEAVQHVEKTAKEAGSSSAPRLWKAWAVELEAVQAGQGLRYPAADGATLNFKQVLVKSCALELAAEAALELGASAAQRDLSHLFGLCFPPSSEFIPETLAELIFRMAVLISPSDTKILKSAKQAVHAVVAALKCGTATSTGSLDESLWLPRLNDLERALDAQATSFLKLQEKSTSPAFLKDQVAVSLEIVRLSEEKLDLLRTGGLVSGAGVSKSNEKAISAIRNLRSILQGLSAVPSKNAGRKSTSNQQGLQMRYSKLTEEIRSAEAKLLRLRAELIEVEDQMQSASNGAGFSAVDYGQHIVAVDALDALMQRSQEANISREAEAAAAARATESGAPSALLEAVERNLQALLAMQGDLHNTLQSTLDKLVRNRRQAQQLADMDGAAAAVESNRRVKDDLDRTMDKIQVGSEAVMRDMSKTLERLDARKDVMKKLPGHASRLPFYRSIDALVAKLQEQSDQILAGLAKRAEEQKVRKPRVASMAAAEELTSEDRVKQLEDMLRAANADLIQKDEQLAKFRHTSQPVANGHGHRSAAVPPAKAAVPVAASEPVKTVPEPILKPVTDPAPKQPVIATSPETGISPPEDPEPSPAIPKAAPRGWGKVEAAPAVLDETLPSLADAMAASKGKRSAKR